MSNTAVKAKGKKKHNIPGYLFILPSVLFFLFYKMCIRDSYHTIILDTPAVIEAGEKFSVVQVIKDGDNQWYIPVEIGADASAQKAVCNRGESYVISSDGPEDLADFSQENITFGNAMIKAFTNNVELDSEAPVLRSFDYEAYDNTDTKIKTQTITAASAAKVINLPAGTSYIKVINPVLFDNADTDTQLTAKVNGKDYTLGDSIAREDLIKENHETTLVMTTRSCLLYTSRCV